MCNLKVTDMRQCGLIKLHLDQIGKNVYAIVSSIFLGKISQIPNQMVYLISYNSYVHLKHYYCLCHFCLMTALLVVPVTKYYFL